MKPTITNAFTVGSTRANVTQSAKVRRSADPNRLSRSHDNSGRSSGEAKDAGVTLAPMQADLREAEFGFSLEITPIQAADAISALLRSALPSMQFLVSMEQDSWREGNADAALAHIASRLGLVPVETISDHQLVLDADALQALTSVTQPQRLLVVAVDGPIETMDAAAINRAIDGAQSPLGVEIRAVAALEVLGDRSVVLHARERSLALSLVAENFRHYLAAILDRSAESFAAPDLSEIEHLMSITGAVTIRPIETQVHGASIDIGVNTSSERFTRPANLSMVYDVPSGTWHTQ